MLNQMSTEHASTHHLLRQRSPLTLAAVCGGTGLVLLVTLLWQWADDPQPLFAAWVLFGLAVVWSLFVRPSVLLDDHGVTLRNVVRDIHIPWALVSDVESRWNLKVFVGDRGYPSWAISSQVERPKGVAGSMFGSIMPGRLDRYASADAAPPPPGAPKVTASMVARMIEQAMQEYAEAVAHGQLPAATDARVRITWVPLVIGVIAVPAIAVAALSLT